MDLWLHVYVLFFLSSFGLVRRYSLLFEFFFFFSKGKKKKSAKGRLVGVLKI